MTRVPDLHRLGAPPAGGGQASSSPPPARPQAGPDLLLLVWEIAALQVRVAALEDQVSILRERVRACAGHDGVTATGEDW